MLIITINIGFHGFEAVLASSSVGTKWNKHGFRPWMMPSAKQWLSWRTQHKFSAHLRNISVFIAEDFQDGRTAFYYANFLEDQNERELMVALLRVSCCVYKSLTNNSGSESRCKRRAPIGWYKNGKQQREFLISFCRPKRILTWPDVCFIVGSLWLWVFATSLNTYNPH